jgi:hypothetical protein
MSTTSASANPVEFLSSPAPPLPYADLPSRWGVTVERLPDGVRVVVPPVPGWRRLGAGFFVGGSILAVFLTIIVATSYSAGDWAALVINGILYGGGLVWVVLAARYRLRRRVVLEVTRDTVAATHLSGGKPRRRVAWPRAKVLEIKLNSSNGKLIVRIAGADFVEMYLGPNRELNAYVAEVLAAALREPVRPASSDAGSESDTGTEGSFDGVRSRAWRRVLLVIAGVMLTAGVVLMVVPVTAAPLGFYLLIFASAPAGIALGTRERAFYT